MNPHQLHRLHATGWLLLSLTLPLARPTAANAQSNLVSNGSFELVDAGWGVDGSLGVVINNYQAYDGTNWLEPYGSLWQDLPTIPGRDYHIEFATKNGASLRVNWGETAYSDVYVSNPNISGMSWVTTNIVFSATTNPTRLRFQATAGAFRLDGVEVRWLHEPVVITVPVPSRSTFAGGAASFPVVAIGAPPLRYQWYRENAAITGATNRVLSLTNLSSAEVGDYWVIVTNDFGATTSLRAKLIVNSLPQTPLIVSQPKAQTIVEGYSTAFHVVAIGVQPMSYQWRQNGTNITDATNASVQIPIVTAASAGDYSVIVSNKSGSVQSISASLQTLPAGSGGGVIIMANRFFGFVDSPVYDTDGFTRLAGSNYVAQLYSGPTPNNLHAVATLNPFRSGSFTGYFYTVSRTIPDVPHGGTVFAQIRVWDFTVGKSFEEAAARGGRFGKSKITSLTAFDPLYPPQAIDFKSFALEAGMSPLATARFERGQKQPGGNHEWILIGDAGYNYVVESRTPPNDWSPIFVLTNSTGSVSFVDTNAPNASPKFYRARIIEP